MQGHGDAALATKKLSLAPGEFGTAARLAIRNVEKPKPVAEPVSDFEALAYLLKGNVTKEQYKLMIKISRKHKSKTWPNYNSLEGAKKDCMPPNIYHSQTEVWVPLQDVLHFDLHGLMEAFPEVIEQIRRLVDSDEEYKFTLDLKWGTDGVGGLVEYQYDQEQIIHDQTNQYNDYCCLHSTTKSKFK